MKIAVIGTGANGGSLGADMIRAGLDVTFIDQWTAHVDAMREHGLIVRSPEGTETTPVYAKHLCQVAEMREPFDIVFVSVKTYDSRWTLELMKPLLHPRTLVVGLQNGMTVDDFADIVGPERTVGAVLGIAANMFEPGEIERQVGRSGTWLAVGMIDGSAPPELDAVVEALQHAGAVEHSQDIRASKWMKLLANIPEMLPSAILGVPLLAAVEVSGIRPVMDESAREAYRVAVAAGVEMRPIFGRTQDEMVEGDDYAIALLENVLESYSLPDTRVAVLQDWLKGRRAELDGFNGVICREGRRLGVPTPINDAILAIGERIESGELSPGLDNADLLRSALGGGDGDVAEPAMASGADRA